MGARCCDWIRPVGIARFALRDFFSPARPVFDAWKFLRNGPRPGAAVSRGCSVHRRGSLSRLVPRRPASRPAAMDGECRERRDFFHRPFPQAPDETTTTVRWFSGFVSLAHSTDQFSEPTLVLAGFTTLFVIGVALAHARLRTQSLWLPIGLHAGWIFFSEAFSKIARREVVALPWLGKSLLIGLVPLAVCLSSWLLLRIWLRYAGARTA